jgi:uncharacterized membrane protein
MRTLALAVAAVLALAAPAVSQELVGEPAFYDISGVAANDVLNVRERPDASSPIIGTLRPDQARIEVIGTLPDGRWGLVNVEELAGWVSMRFMAPSPIAMPDLPGGLTCSGTEPFWSATFTTPESWTLDLSYMSDVAAPIAMSGWSKPAINRVDWAFGFTGQGGVTRASGVIALKLCEDGMSLRAAGYEINMIVDGAERFVINGCCSLGAN